MVVENKETKKKKQSIYDYCKGSKSFSFYSSVKDSLDPKILDNEIMRWAGRAISNKKIRNNFKKYYKMSLDEFEDFMNSESKAIDKNKKRS